MDKLTLFLLILGIPACSNGQSRSQDNHSGDQTSIPSLSDSLAAEHFVSNTLFDDPSAAGQVEGEILELERAAYLGLKVENNATQGVKVLQVFEGGSGAAMGLLVNDVLISMDDRPITHVGAFLSTIAERTEGDTMAIGLIRDRTEMTVVGKLNGKPLEQPALGTIHYGTVAYDGGRLRSILNLPPSAEAPPVVYFIQGYSCRSIDVYWNDQNRLRRIVDGLVAEGFAVFRVEKPGMGDSRTMRKCSEIGYHEETEAFLAGLRAQAQWLRGRRSRIPVRP